MGDIKTAEPVKLFSGIIARGESMVAAARVELERLGGPIDHESEAIPFDFTDYYTPEMGEGLFRKFVSFEKLIDPARIVEIKLGANAIEERLGVTAAGVLHRRVNLDPGYVAPSRLVLATTKDFSHRIYLDQGIYAEVTLNFTKHGCTFHPWTFPDYKSGKYTDFFLRIREILMEQTRGAEPRRRSSRGSK